jgi:GTPase SAR1 family protein
MTLGLPGVGKTVLLNQIKERAISIGYPAEVQEVHDGGSTETVADPVLRRLLRRLDRTQNAVETVK